MIITIEISKMHMQNTVYPKKYAHGFCFAVLCCRYTLTDFPISIRLTSLSLWQSNDCPSASKATLMNMDKYFMWIHYERLLNHNKAKHNKTVCIFLGIYCTLRMHPYRHYTLWQGRKYAWLSFKQWAVLCFVIWSTISPFLPEASFGLRVLSLAASVCLCVRVCGNHLLVCAITCHAFKLKSPNLDNKSKTPLLRSLLFWRVIDLELQGQI